MVQTYHGQIRVCDPDQSVIVLQLFIDNHVDGGAGQYTLVVEKAALSSANHQSPSVIFDTPITIPWLDWSRRARMLLGGFVRAARVHGTRFVGVDMASHALQIYDFNSRRRPNSLDQDDAVTHGREMVTVMEESIIYSGVYAEPVRTSLPYHMVSQGPTSAYNYVLPLMDDKYLITVPRTIKPDISPSFQLRQ